MYVARILALCLALLLMALPVGCDKKPGEMPMSGYEELLAATHEVTQGKSLTLTVPLPSETAVSADPVCSDGLTAQYTAPDLTITGLEPGAQTVSITFGDEGYNDGTLTLPVTVNAAPPPQLQAALVSAQLGLNAPVGGSSTLDIVMYQGQLAQLQLLYRLTGVTVSMDADPAYLDYQQEKNHFVLTALQPGSTSLTVTASTQGFKDAQVTCNIEIREPSSRMAGELPTLVEKPHTDPAYAGLAKDIFAAANAQRQQAGLPAYTYNKQMDTAAFTRAQEAAESWSHTRPDGRRSYTVFADNGLDSFLATGENLSCADFAETGEEVVARWMESTMGHREAILHSGFTDVSIGVYYDQEMYYYCMLFAQQ